MRKLLKFLSALFFLIYLTGCETNSAENESKVKDHLPIMSLNHEGLYNFNKVIPKEEIDMSQIVYTGTYTGHGDRVKHGKEILIYKTDNSIFIVDNDGPTEEWVNFTKIKDK